jgi:predicted Rossmann fold flavoprotein
MPAYDAIVVGAGAAGLFCAGVAGQRGVRVLLIDHSPKVAEKIRISGGGRCNFTNVAVGASHFHSNNPSFCRSALSRYTPQNFLNLLQEHGVAWHEKHKGQLFCDESAQDIIDLLLHEVQRGGVDFWHPCSVQHVQREEAGFELQTSRGPVRAPQLVVATGGLSVPKIGATDWGYRLAQQFGHQVVTPRPALVPLTFEAKSWAPWVDLAGLAVPVNIRAESGPAFFEDLLFTHKGLSGPGVLQISSLWRMGHAVQIDLAPELDLATHFKQAKASSKRQLKSELASVLPNRLAAHWLQNHPGASLAMAEQSDKSLKLLAQALHRWSVAPNGTQGYAKAEVTVGGVDTRDVSSKTMQSQRTAGLHFVGEVLDVTGWLGGYNFQWAWSSAWACAQALRMVGSV